VTAAIVIDASAAGEIIARTESGSGEWSLTRTDASSTSTSCAPRRPSAEPQGHRSVLTPLTPTQVGVGTNVAPTVHGERLSPQNPDGRRTRPYWDHRFALGLWHVEHWCGRRHHHDRSTAQDGRMIRDTTKDDRLPFVIWK